MRRSKRAAGRQPRAGEPAGAPTKNIGRRADRAKMGARGCRQKSLPRSVRRCGGNYSRRSRRSGRSCASGRSAAARRIFIVGNRSWRICCGSYGIRSCGGFSPGSSGKRNEERPTRRIPVRGEAAGRQLELELHELINQSPHLEVAGLAVGQPIVTAGGPPLDRLEVVELQEALDADVDEAELPVGGRLHRGLDPRNAAEAEVEQQAPEAVDLVAQLLDFRASRIHHLSLRQGVAHG